MQFIDRFIRLSCTPAPGDEKLTAADNFAAETQILDDREFVARK